jgi:hypothetical protein
VIRSAPRARRGLHPRLEQPVAAFGAMMEQVFEADAANAVEIELDEWGRRSLWQRTKELYSRLMRCRL